MIPHAQAVRILNDALDVDPFRGAQIRRCIFCAAPSTLYGLALIPDGCDLGPAPHPDLDRYIAYGLCPAHTGLPDEAARVEAAVRAAYN